MSAHAQTIISGHVKDLQGEAVAGATVLLYSDSLLTPPMKGYAITRKDGSYSISPNRAATCGCRQSVWDIKTAR